MSNNWMPLIGTRIKATQKYISVPAPVGGYINPQQEGTVIGHHQYYGGDEYTVLWDNILFYDEMKRPHPYMTGIGSWTHFHGAKIENIGSIFDDESERVAYESIVRKALNHNSKYLRLFDELEWSDGSNDNSLIDSINKIKQEEKYYQMTLFAWGLWYNPNEESPVNNPEAALVEAYEERNGYVLD